LGFTYSEQEPFHQRARQVGLDRVMEELNQRFELDLYDEYFRRETQRTGNRRPSINLAAWRALPSHGRMRTAAGLPIERDPNTGRAVVPIRDSPYIRVKDLESEFDPRQFFGTAEGIGYD